MSEAIILTPGIDCAHEWHPIELVDTTCGYVDGDWLICDKCRSMVKKVDAEAERDRLAATVGRLAGFIAACRNCCEVYQGRCRKGREVPGLAALGGGGIGANGLTHSQQQARIAELEDMIERFWGTDAVKRAERAERALQEMETRADFFEAKVVDVEAERDVLASKLEQTTMERIKARNERDRYRQQRDALKAAVRLMWNRVPVVEHDYAEMADRLEKSDRALHKTLQSVLAVTGEWDKAKSEAVRLLEERDQLLTQLAAEQSAREKVESIWRGRAETAAEQYRITKANRDTLAAQLEAMKSALYGISNLMVESTGVVGWHLNGDVATWDELGWPQEIDGLLNDAALAAAPEAPTLTQSLHANRADVSEQKQRESAAPEAQGEGGDRD